MARARNIKPSIMDNEELAELEPVARLLFIYLWMLADREGRLEDRPKRIAAQALPYDRQVDVGAMLDELHKAGFILRYEAAGVACIQITAFAKHQSPHIREAESVLPSCTSQGEDEHKPRKVQERERDDTHLAESLRRRIIDRDGGKCLCCSSDADLHVDHIIPRARGGKTDESNLQTLCRKCNQSKGARNQTDYRSTNLGTASTSPRSPDSGFSDSGYLIADTSDSGESPAPTSIPEKQNPDPRQATAVTMAGAVCVALKSIGMMPVNPSHPGLRALLDSGADIGTFVEIGRECVKNKKPFAYLLAAVKGRMADSAAMADAEVSKTQPHVGILPGAI